MPSETKLAWAAGIIEGEGHIGTHWQKPNPKRREINGRWRTVVSVSNTLFEIPLELHRLFGGAIHERETTAGRPVMMWQTTQNGAIRVLEATIPYMVAKRGVAQENLDRCRSRVDKRVRTHCPYGHEIAVVGRINGGGCRECHRGHQHRFYMKRKERGSSLGNK